MRWKTVVGWVLVVFGALALVRLLTHFQASSYAMGNLTGDVLIVLLGVWLVRSGRPSVRSR